MDVRAAAPFFCLLLIALRRWGVDLGRSGGLIVDSCAGATSGSACCVGCCIRLLDSFPYKLFNFVFDLLNGKSIFLGSKNTMRKEINVLGFR
jgi:hypothetical protein